MEQLNISEEQLDHIIIRILDYWNGGKHSYDNGATSQTSGHRDAKRTIKKAFQEGNYAKYLMCIISALCDNSPEKVSELRYQLRQYKKIADDFQEKYSTKNIDALLDAKNEIWKNNFIKKYHEDYICQNEDVNRERHKKEYWKSERDKLAHKLDQRDKQLETYTCSDNVLMSRKERDELYEISMKKSSNKSESKEIKKLKKENKKLKKMIMELKSDSDSDSDSD